MKYKYILGNGTIPYWCNKYITQYKKLDGTTGFEFYGKNKTIDLNKGDLIEMLEDGYLTVTRKEKTIDVSEKVFISCKTN